jgi:histidinol-phosphatase (PHP family)
VKEIYPSLAFLKMARQLNLPISFGSDAHAPEEVGMNFKEGIGLAKEAGYTEAIRLQGRKRVPYKI